MANRLKKCKGKKSDSSCTCGSNHECQETSNHERTLSNDVTSAHDKQNNGCSSECINCKLLNRLYVLLEEIIENRQISKNTENFTSLSNNNTNDKQCKVFNVYNNNTGSNKLLLCDCDKSKTNQDETSNYKKEHIPRVSKRNEDASPSSAQYWHNIGELKNQNQVDFACQCSCPKKDSSTQDYSTQKGTFCPNHKKDLKKCSCIDTAVNTDTQNNSCVPNPYCSLLNDPMFREAMKLMHCPNFVVCTGCNCCNKCNIPLERTSVTTNTSEIIVPSQDGNITSAELSPTQPTLNRRSQRLSNIDKSIEDLPCQSENNNLPRLSENKDLSYQSENKDSSKGTSFKFPQETEFTVASALVTGKKKGASKSKKRKSKGGSESKESNEKKDFINICCQTEKNVIEQKCVCTQQVKKNEPEANCECMVKTANNVKDAAVCCDLYKSKVPQKNEEEHFITILTDLSAQINKIKEKTDGIVPCECKNISAKTPVAPNTNSSKDNCLEIQRLAEKIAEIHLKSSRNNSNSTHPMLRNSLRKSVEKTTNSDCDLNSCIHVNSLPSNNISDNTEECWCQVCRPCKKSTERNKKDVCPIKKEKRCRSSKNPTPTRASKKLNELDYANLNKWTSESPQKCACSNNECMKETELECVNYNISNYSKDDDNCTTEKCPQLRRIMKECMCGTKNCYCHNEKLNELKTTANIEHLVDQVISTITPCNCMGQQCTCNNIKDPGIKRYSTRQVCFSNIYHENQWNISNIKDKGKKLFDKDVNGNPCLNRSKSETNFYIKNLVRTKPIKNKTCLKKVIPSSAKKLKPFLMKPILPIQNTPCTQINYIKSLFPDIYRALSKIKELTNWETLPQEIVEIVIDKILKREIKSALQQMKEGVVKVNANNGNGNNNNTNILNILLEEQINSDVTVKEFKNNILDKRSEQTKQTPNIDKKIQQLQETTNITENNIENKLETINIDQKDFDSNKKPILVQINIVKEKKSSQKDNKISIENSCVSLNAGVSSSSIYITENKLEAIKDLITLGNNNAQHNWEDNASDSTTILSLNEANKPISININIQMDKEKDSILNTDEIKINDLSTFSLSKENTNENTQTDSSKELEKSKFELDRIIKFMDDLQEKNKSVDELQEKKKSMNDMQEKKKSNVDLQETACLFYHNNKSELPSLEDFLAMNENMKVQKIKITPSNINKSK